MIHFLDPALLLVLLGQAASPNTLFFLEPCNWDNPVQQCLVPLVLAFHHTVSLCNNNPHCLIDLLDQWRPVDSNPCHTELSHKSMEQNQPRRCSGANHVTRVLRFNRKDELVTKLIELDLPMS